MRRIQFSNLEFIPPTQISLLLILSESPAHAWHIKKVLDERGFEEWVNMKKSTIYKNLGILEEKGYIKGSKKSQEQLSRKIYKITGSGQKKLKEQIQFCLCNPPKAKTLFDLGLAGISLVTKSNAISALEKYKGHLDNRIKWFERILNQMDSVNEIVREGAKQRIVGGMTAEEFQSSGISYCIKALFDRPYWVLKAQKAWLEGFIHSIKEDDGEFMFQEE
ncbi:MAG: PadR family transcriptional regulator [Promethearchaeota archaeon]